MFESQRNILITIIIFALVILCGGSIWLAANLTGRDSDATAVPTPTPDAYPGLLILKVNPDSPAALGGLQPAHILLQVDGTPVNTPDELQPIFAGKNTGDTTTLIMLVDGEMQQTAVIHPAAPPYLGVDLVENWSGATALLTPTPPTDIAETSEPDIEATVDVSQLGLAVVNNVLPDTPAADAGLESGDVLTAVNNAAILTNAELVDQISSRKPGDTITLTFRRGPDTLTRDIILIAHPDNPEQGYLGLELLPHTP